MDSIDRAIISQLVGDGRLSNVELSERVRLSPSACLRRVRALEQAGVIRGYHADIDPAMKTPKKIVKKFKKFKNQFLTLFLAETG